MKGLINADNFVDDLDSRFWSLHRDADQPNIGLFASSQMFGFPLREHNDLLASLQKHTFEALVKIIPSI